MATKTVEIKICDICKEEKDQCYEIKINSGVSFDDVYQCVDPEYVYLDICSSCVADLAEKYLENKIPDIMKKVKEKDGEYSKAIRKALKKKG